MTIHKKGKEREGSDRVGGYHDPGQRFSRRQAASEDKTLGGGWGGEEGSEGGGGEEKKQRVLIQTLGGQLPAIEPL